MDGIPLDLDTRVKERKERSEEDLKKLFKESSFIKEKSQNILSNNCIEEEFNLIQKESEKVFIDIKELRQKSCELIETWNKKELVLENFKILISFFKKCNFENLEDIKKEFHLLDLKNNKILKELFSLFHKTNSTHYLSYYYNSLLKNEWLIEEEFNKKRRDFLKQKAFEKYLSPSYLDFPPPWIALNEENWRKFLELCIKSDYWMNIDFIIILLKKLWDYKKDENEINDSKSIELKLKRQKLKNFIYDYINNNYINIDKYMYLLISFRQEYYSTLKIITSS